MAKNPDNPDRLDEMLREWGARKAIDQADVPARRVATAGGGGSFRRWGPLVAAAVLLAASAGIVLFSGGSASQGEDGPDAMGQGSVSEVRRLEGELKRLRGELADSRTALAKAAERLETLPRSEQELRSAIEKEFEAMLVSRKKRWETQQLKPALAKLKTLTDRLDVREAKLDMLKAELAKAKADPNRLAELEKTLAAALDELTATRLAVGEQRSKILQLRKQGDEHQAQIVSLESTVKTLREHSRALQQIKRREARLWDRMAGIYVNALAPRQRGMEAVVTAAGSAGLSSRLASVQRKSDLDEDTRTLLATLEVVVVRLELLDAGDADELAALRAAIRKQRLLERIDEALGDEKGDAGVATLLTETKLLLVELHNAA